jgi:hypothetical protein
VRANPHQPSSQTPHILGADHLQLASGAPIDGGNSGKLFPPFRGARLPASQGIDFIPKNYWHVFSATIFPVPVFLFNNSQCLIVAHLFLPQST